MDAGTELTLETKPKDDSKLKRGRPKEKRKRLRDFAPTMRIVLADHTVVTVPVNADAARAQGQVLAAKVRQFFEIQLAKMEHKTLTPKEIQDLVIAAARVDDLQRVQFTDPIGDKPVGEGKIETPMGKQIDRMIQAAAKGATEGATNSMMDKLKAMQQAGERKAEPVIEVGK